MSGQTFGQRVATRRLALDLSVRRAAQLSGVSETAWHNIERGRELRRGVRRNSPNPPQKTTVRKIAAVLEWQLDQALRWAGYDQPAADTAASGPPRSVEASWSEIDRLWPLLSIAQRWALVYVAATMLTPQQWPEYDRQGGRRPSAVAPADPATAHRERLIDTPREADDEGPDLSSGREVNPS